MRRLLATCAFLLSGLLLTSLWTALAQAQGVLVNVDATVRMPLPRPIVVHHTTVVPSPPPATYKIKELSVQARLRDQVAQTQVSQTFVNTGSVQMEVCFVFPLPYDGAVEQMTLLVDGKEYAAKLLDASAARKTYEEIVRKNRDPALLEWMGAGMFKTSVFPVPPGAERKVSLRYSQLCRKDRGLTDYIFPLSTAKYTSHPVEKLDVRLSIESSEDIKNVYSPSHSVKIERPDSKHAVVTLTTTNEVPTSDLRLLYDVGAGAVGASVISYRPKTDEDGYFLLLASPEVKAADAERPKKTIVFVVDRSGSMSGEKFEQARGALKFVLNNLREGDLFNIVAYDSHVESFKPELQKYNDETRQAATGYINGLYPGGSTNINGALTKALEQLKDSSRPNYIIFLTDGLPTDGETSEAKIVANAKSNNHVRARVFSFGVGYDVNSRLLDKLVRENFGQSEYVRPSENIEARVSSLYNRIGSPVLTDLKLEITVDGIKTEDGPAVNRLYPADARDLFAGEQMVVVGRYRKSGAAKVMVTGKVGDQEQKFDFPANLTEKSGDESQSFVEKLWAVRRIGQIIDDLDLKGKNEELVKELVQLSLKHGIMTPYTSFLADENSDRRDLALSVDRAGKATDALREAAGEYGFAQRAAKGDYQRAAQAPINNPIAASAAARPSAGAGFGGGYGGRDAGGQLRAGAPAPTATSNAAAAINAVNKDAKFEQLAQNVQNIGRKTFYRRGQQWVDNDVTKEQEAKVIKVERFSPQYFELAAKHGAKMAKYLVIDEPVLLEIDGQAYEF